MTVNLSTLTNGIRVVTDVMSDVMTASVNVYVKVGSRHEELKINGLSHFLEHMAFKGTKTRSALQIAESFENIGGYMNAGTGRENTVYFGKVLKDDIETAIDVISDILINSVFDEEEIVREKNVVLQEIAQTNDTPDDLIFDLHFETAFAEQAFGRSILGTVDNVNSFSKTNLQEYINTHYTAENIVVAVAGNVKHKQIVDLCEKYFASYQNKGKRNKLEAAKYIGGQCYRQKDDLEQIHLIIGFNGLSYHDDNLYTAQILANILGGGMSSRLFQEIREKHGLAYSVGAYHASYNDSGMFNIYSGTTTENIGKMIPLIFQEIHKLIENITEEEMERCRTQCKAGLLMGMESSASRSDHIGRSYTCYDRNVTMQEIIEKVNKITKSDVQNIMKNMLSAEKPTISTIGNLKNMPDYDKIISYI